MSFIAILVDLIAAGFYHFQSHNPSEIIQLIGLTVQALLAVITLFILLAYKGKRFNNLRIGTQQLFSLRFAVILISFILNMFLLLSYTLNHFAVFTLFS